MPTSVANLPLQSRRFPVLVALALAGALVLAAGVALFAQVSGERGIAPVASSTDIAVRGIEVNVTGDSAEDARQNGWREAQRLAWKKIEGPDIPDSRLDGLVSAIVVEEENIGPRRYVARLGVIFDRQRAGGLLGAGGERARSAPMLTLPVMISGGTQTMFESRNAWQRAWAEYQFGASSIDYVRPSGAGGESLLLTYGQTGRRSRAWWNTVLDQFSAADVLVPVVSLRYEWPGGPVEGRFTARYGPDNRFLDEFTMRAESASELGSMLDRAVTRFDRIFQRALASGRLTPDPTLTLDNIEISPEIRALLEAARRAEDSDRANDGEEPPVTSPGGTASPATGAATDQPAATLSSVSVQAATASAAAFDQTLTSVRRISGVRGVAVTSTAIGGTSVLVVSFAGTSSELAAALRSGGFQVVEGGNSLAISR